MYLNLDSNIQGLPNLRVLELSGNPIAPRSLPGSGGTQSAQEQVIQLQNNMNAAKPAGQPMLTIAY